MSFGRQQVIQVACGGGSGTRSEAHTLALTLDGRVWAWGEGAFGKLGLGHSESRLTPTLVPTFLNNGNSQPPIVAIACGAQFSVALNCAGTVFTWGKASQSWW